MNGKELLTHAGKISHESAIEKAGQEYEKYLNEKRKEDREESLQELENDIKKLSVK
jgi:hypothetical protein